jgi:hypothetical protein
VQPIHVTPCSNTRPPHPGQQGCVWWKPEWAVTTVELTEIESLNIAAKENRNPATARATGLDVFGFLLDSATHGTAIGRACVAPELCRACQIRWMGPLGAIDQLGGNSCEVGLCCRRAVRGGAVESVVVVVHVVSWRIDDMPA